MNKKGFSIIEVLVATAIMVTTALAIGELLSQFSKFRKYMDASSEYNNFLNQIEITLKNDVSCNKAFGTSGAINALRSAVITTKAPDPNNLGPFETFDVPLSIGDVNYDIKSLGKVPLYNQQSSGVLISVMKVGKTVKDSTLTTPTDGTTAKWNRYSMSLYVKGETMKVGATLAESKANVLGPSYLKPRNIPFIVTMDSTNSTIKNCTSAITAKALCTDMGGSWLDATQECDLLPGIKKAQGGCAQAGGYTLESGRCDSPNPSTLKCNCPTGFTAMQTSDFTAGGGKSSVSIDIFGCFQCN